ncbi:hypothetical protein EVAR_99998_1 [Eumeta japonica]|uniref:Uncharacterized protein n=1 Tax=Eumeta variegata TaxID=151549 RepID=A0A4C2A7Z0_EUMVA|nr:hypothetical protein EVAR_99998_1 [Eumeta japonica]
MKQNAGRRAPEPRIRTTNYAGAAVSGAFDTGKRLRFILLCSVTIQTVSLASLKHLNYENYSVLRYPTRSVRSPRWRAGVVIEEINCLPVYLISVIRHRLYCITKKNFNVMVKFQLTSILYVRDLNVTPAACAPPTTNEKLELVDTSVFLNVTLDSSGKQLARGPHLAC